MTDTTGTEHGGTRATQRRRRFLLLVAVLGAGAVVAALLGAAIPASGILAEDSRFWNGDAPGWASIVGVTLCVVGVVIVAAGFWWLARNGYYRRNERSRLWAESWSRRRQLVRQVRGRVAPRDEDRPLLPRVAAHLVDQPKFLAPLCGLALLQIGQAFLQWAPAFLLLAVIFVGALTVAAVSSLRAAHQAKAFLAGDADAVG